MTLHKYRELQQYNGKGNTQKRKDPLTSTLRKSCLSESQTREKKDNALDTDNYFSWKKEKKVTDVNPSYGNLQEKVMEK